MRGSPDWFRDLAGAWVFYTVLPAWPRVRPSFARIARFAPLIGLVLGGLQALLWLGTARWLPLGAQVALVMALGLLLSGGLHHDGALDTADGLAAGPRALEAMADSRIGASGVQAALLLALLRAAGLLSLAGAAPLALVWAGFWARLSPLVAMQWFPYLRARPQGGGGTAAFHRDHWRGLARELRPALLALPVPVLLTIAAGGRPWSGLAVLGLAPAVLVPLRLGRRLGGHSGDTYGACVEWTESLALLLMGAALRAVAG
ncbi:MULTISPECIES: adenosylcobinamide-GDP ribazoletransferase [Aphanothece]|uniref:adenosylcobinamide-GDP ribazoletransferase n=1 Tax=Aphanothece TaxID=1121 RepID=UPI00398488CF